MNRLINGNLNFNYASLIGSQGLTSDMVMDIGTGGNNLTADIAYIESHLGSSLTGNITMGTTNANIITINSGSTIYNNNEVITLKDNSITGLQFGSVGNTNMMVLDTSDATSNVNLSSGTNLILNDVTDASSSTDINSALVVSGGIACAKRFVCGNIVCNGNTFTGATVTGTNLSVTGTTASSNSLTGAIVCSGGLGVAGQINCASSIIGGSFACNGNIQAYANSIFAGNITAGAATASTTYLTGAIVCGGGMGIAGVINSNAAINTVNSMSCGGFTNAGQSVLSYTLDSTSITSGAITCAGGVGIAKKLYVGTLVSCAGNVSAANLISSGYVSAVNGYFSNGITLATAGGMASTLDYYEEFSINTTWCTYTGLIATATVTHTFVRVGKLVTMRIPVFSGNFLGSFPYVPPTYAIPARFRPIATSLFNVQVSNTNGTIGVAQAYCGQLAVLADGRLSLALSGGGSGLFGSGLGSGLGADAHVSWIIL